EKMNQTSRFIQFIGGRNLLFGLVTLILLGLVILIYNRISFVFEPVFVVASTIVPPIIVAAIAFYLLNPVVNILEKYKIQRLWGIVIILLVFIGIVTGLMFIIVTIISDQIKELIESFPDYIDQLNQVVQNLLSNSIFENYYHQARAWGEDTLGDIPVQITSYLGNFRSGFASVAQTLVTIGITIGTFPFVL